MPVRWELRGSVLILVFSDIVERAEIEGALAAAFSDPRFTPGMGLLWDARSSQTLLSSDDVTWRLDLVSALAKRGLVNRAAVVVTEQWRATLDYFRAVADRMAPGFRLAMFVDEPEALAWLEADTGVLRRRSRRTTPRAGASSDSRRGPVAPA